MGNTAVPCIAQLTQAKGRRWVAVAIVAELEGFARKMGFEKRLTADSLVDIATNLRDNMGQYKFEDIQAFLRGAALGKYGSFVYGNSAELMEMWDDYIMERTRYAVRINSQKQAEYDADNDAAADKVRAGYERVRREAIEADRRATAKRFAISERTKLRSKCNREAVRLWNKALEAAAGRMDFADFAETLTAQDISDALFTARAYRLPKINSD